MSFTENKLNRIVSQAKQGENMVAVGVVVSKSNQPD